MDRHGVFKRKRVADVTASGGAAFKCLPKFLGAVQHHRPWRRRHYRRRHFRPHRHGGRAVRRTARTIAFVLAAAASGLVGLCCTELATLLPVQGSTYTDTFATLGELAA